MILVVKLMVISRTVSTVLFNQFGSCVTKPAYGMVLEIRSISPPCSFVVWCFLLGMHRGCGTPQFQNSYERAGS